MVLVSSFTLARSLCTRGFFGRQNSQGVVLAHVLCAQFGMDTPVIPSDQKENVLEFGQRWSKSEITWLLDSLVGSCRSSCPWHSPQILKVPRSRFEASGTCVADAAWVAMLVRIYYALTSRKCRRVTMQMNPWMLLLLILLMFPAVTRLHSATCET